MTKYIALDLETYLIEGKGHLPKPICLSWWMGDGSDVGVIGNDLYDCPEEGEFEEGFHGRIKMEMKLHEIFWDVLTGQYEMVWHNGFSFDLPVLFKHFPSLRQKILDVLDRGLVHDTLIREKLLAISVMGEVKAKRGYFSLAGLTKKYIGLDISASKKGPDIWRLRYGELDGKDVEEYPKEAFDYALQDVDILMRVFLAQKRIINPEGPGSANTEELQIKSGFALSLATNRGLCIDDKNLEDLEEKIDKKLNPLKDKLLKLGFAEINKKGQYGKANKKFISYLEENYPNNIQRTFPTDRHKNGQASIDE